MQEAINTAIHAINFAKSYPVKNRLFAQFREDEKFNCKMIVKGLSLEKLEWVFVSH